MSFVRNRLPILLSLVATVSLVQAIDKDKKKWAPGPASSFSSKQASSGLVIAAEAFHRDELAAQAFGKLKLHDHGVLPVLLVLQNDSKKAIRLDSLKVEYIDAVRSKVEAIPASDVPYLKGPERPNFNPSPIPGLRRKKKNELAGPEIEMRAFAAKMLPPGESAHGFFYFQTRHMPGAKLYVTGLTDAATGPELLYFDIPLDY